MFWPYCICDTLCNHDFAILIFQIYEDLDELRGLCYSTHQLASSEGYPPIEGSNEIESGFDSNSYAKKSRGVPTFAKVCWEHVFVLSTSSSTLHHN
jgi:hypothetical protein